MKKNFLNLLYILPLILLCDVVVFGQDQNAKSDSKESAREDLQIFSFVKPEKSDLATYEFTLWSDEQIFPSVILTIFHAAKTKVENNRTQFDLGDSNIVFDIFVKVKKRNQKIKVKTFRNRFINQETENEFLVKDSDHVFRVSPTIAWDFDKLSKLKEPTTETFKFELVIEGQPVITKIFQPRIRSVNDAVIAMKNKSGQFQSTARMTFAGFVNENSSVVDHVLKETKDLGLKAEVGEVVFDKKSNANYNQSLTFGKLGTGASSPYLQVSAIWFYLQSKNYKYSSLTRASGFSNSILSQSVRSVEEIFNSTQANCVEGTILFASILQKIGIESYLVIVPGHMYLMFYNDLEKKLPFFIETTMLGNTKISVFEHARNNAMVAGISIDKLSTGLYRSEFERSYKSFYEASEVARKSFYSNYENFKSKNNIYSIVDVSELRKIGINPIGK